MSPPSTPTPPPATSSPEVRKKKPYKELTLEEKVQLIRLAEDNAGLSQAAIADKYKIAKSNVCRILQRKHEYLTAFEKAGFAGNRKRKLKKGEGDGLLVAVKDGNETLRAHMYKQHQISRMFMCRCCNWAFPDKTSLHMHIQAREEGKSISVPVIGKGMASEAYPDHPPPFSSLLNINNNINNNNNSIPPFPNGVIQQPQPMNFFPTVPPPPNPDDLGRLRDRLMMNQIMNQQALGNTFNWLNQLPKPIPTTRPIDLSTKTDEDLNVNVEKDNENQKSLQEDKLIVTVSDNEDTKSKRTDSPCENGCSSSTEGSSPSHTDSAMSPVNIFRKSRGTPSAFHHLNVDSRGFSGATSPSHVSPSETHSSISPDGPTTHACYECAIYKTKLTMADNKCRYLENRANSLQTEAIRAQSQMASAESAFRVLENETRALREHTEQVQRKLLDCQEQALRFVQSERTCSQQAVIMFLNQLIQSTIIR